MKLLSLLYGPQELGQTFMRYFPAFINTKKRISIKKYLNAAYAEFERKIKRTVVKAKPFILHIELTNVCNLKCPYCITGSDTHQQQKGFMNFEGYKKIIDELKDYLILVRLDGLGESFLNKDFIKMVKYASDNDIITSVSTNFVTIKPDETQMLIDAGLDYLIVGLDGASEEVYNLVRTGGKLETVTNNLRTLVQKKKDGNCRIPFIETQFITFNENAHESDKVKELSMSLGADRHTIKDLRELPQNVVVNKKNKVKSCYWLWYVVNITWQGDLKACCLAGLDSNFSFGNIIKNNTLDEWNNLRMQKIRKLFREKDPAIMEEFKGCICIECYKLV